MKHLYRGVFNYSREVETVYRMAGSPQQAWFVMTEALSRKHDVNPELVRSRFPLSEEGGHVKGPNYEIGLELEMKEIG